MAGEQRHLVTLFDKFFGQVRSDPFGAAIELGRYALNQRGNLGDSHLFVLLLPMREETKRKQ